MVIMAFHSGEKALRLSQQWKEGKGGERGTRTLFGLSLEVGRLTLIQRSFQSIEGLPLFVTTPTSASALREFALRAA